jgi:hypothetical protein
VICISNQPELRHKAEIEQDDSPRTAHQDIGGLDVTVELSRSVQSLNAESGLSQGGAQPVEMKAARPTSRGRCTKLAQTGTGLCQHIECLGVQGGVEPFRFGG